MSDEYRDRLAEIYRQSPSHPPSVGGFFGWAAPGPQYGAAPGSYRPQAPVIGQAVGVGVAMLAVLVTSGVVAANHLGDSREQAFRSARARVAEVTKERDSAIAALAQASSAIAEHGQSIEKTCSAQVEELNKIQNALGGPRP